MPADDPVLVESENTLLDLFSDLGALYRPRTEAETSGTDGMATVNTQEYFLAYLQWLDADQAGLPERYRRLGDLQAAMDEHVFDIAPLLEWAERDEQAGAPVPPEPEE